MTIRTMGSETTENLMKCCCYNTMAAKMQLEKRGWVDESIKKDMDGLVYEAAQRLFHEAQSIGLDEYVVLEMIQYKLSTVRTQIYFEETFHMKF